MAKKDGDIVAYCAWDIRIKGKSLSMERRSCITDIEISQQCDGSDSCNIKLKDPDFLYIQDDIYVKDVPVSVYMLWSESGNKIKFDGYVSAIDINFPSEGIPEVSLFCLDKTHLMNLKEKTRTWDNTTSAKVIQQIAKEYGFDCVIENGYNFKTQETISQSNQTDIAFCEGLAEEEESLFMCKVLDNTLYYVKKGLLKNSVATFTYKDYPHDVISFSPQINKSTKKIEIVSSDIDTADKKVVTEKVNINTVSTEITQGTPTKPSDNPVNSTKPLYPTDEPKPVYGYIGEGVVVDFSESSQGTVY